MTEVGCSGCRSVHSRVVGIVGPIRTTTHDHLVVRLRIQWTTPLRVRYTGAAICLFFQFFGIHIRYQEWDCECLRVFRSYVCYLCMRSIYGTSPVHVPALLGYFYYIHRVIYITVGMHVVQYMLGVCGRV
jgi:hypothetical protein